MLNLATILEDSASRYPDHPAFTFGDKTLSYKEINAAANQVANGLAKLGIGKQDKVALSCLNIPYFPIIYFGILKVGAVVAPLSVLLKEEEIAYHLNDSEALVYFCFEGSPELPMGKMGYAGYKKAQRCEHFIIITANPGANSSMEEVSTFSQFTADQPVTYEMEQTGADDTCVIIYTSGTTGKPKGAELSHSNLFLNAGIAGDLFNINSKDTSLIVLPLFHSFAMTCLMNAGVYRGTHAILLPRFDPETVFYLLEKHKVTVFAGVPTMYWGLLNYKDDKFDYDKITRNLRMAASGGAALPVQVLHDFEKRFNVKILEGYGMSEGSPVVTFNQLDAGTKPGSIGTPVWGVKVKLVDDDGNEVSPGEKGELLYKGHNVMKGYYKKPEANAKTLINGWLYSGDVAIKDEDGYYFIVDRTKDMIIRGGLNVYPREVEEAMIVHDAVSLVAVIGVPHEVMGEEIKAYVVIEDGKKVTEDELIKYTKSKLAAYKYPRIIEFIDSLPISATGKILKKELRKRDI